MSIEAMKQALEALEMGLVETFHARQENAITALRTAIEAAEKQEPVACRFCCDERGCWAWQCDNCGEIDDSLEVPPPAAPVQPVQPEQEPNHYRHTWGQDGERCVVCGDKDWMGTSCKKISAPAAPVQRTEQEPVAWKNAAIRLGEELSSVGPDGYYNMTAEQWLDWAMDQHPQGKNSLTTPPAAAPVQEPVAWMFEDDEGDKHKTFRQTPPSPEDVAYIAKWNRPAWVPLYTTPPQRKPLTDEKVVEMLGNLRESITGNVFLAFARAIEAAHGIKEKNK
jgi:hypothetical protein